jgi:hypothetical protein
MELDSITGASTHPIRVRRAGSDPDASPGCWRPVSAAVTPIAVSDHCEGEG